MEEKQKKKHSHGGHRQRVKDKAIQAGIEHWPSHEILELMLMYAIPQKDVNPLAHELIDTFGSIGGVLDAGFEQLIKIKGIGKDSALFLSILPDIFSKYTASKNTGDILLDKSGRIVNYFRTIDRVRDTETFYIFCLNNKRCLIKTVKFNSDLESFIKIPLADFASKIGFKGNKSIVIMHSHPNGDVQPTQADMQATKKLIRLAKTIGVGVNDHIIITDSHYYSFLDSDLLAGLINEVENEELFN